MKKMFGLILAVAMLCTMLAGCDESSVSRKENDYQETLMQQAADEIGMPEITEFFEKKLAKEIFEKRDDSGLICYAYSQSMDGRLIFVGKCYGYGLPYSTQYTNPETPYWGNGSQLYRDYSLPQSDPNGLYGADGLSATWLMMINEDTGEPYIMYCEPTIVVTEHKMPARLVAEWSLPSNY